MFAVLSSACTWTSVILAGNSRRHSTTGFRENVLVAESSYQVLEVLSLCESKRAWPPLVKITELAFGEQQVKWSFLGCLFLEKNTRKKLKSNLVLVVTVVLVLKSKGLYDEVAQESGSILALRNSPIVHFLTTSTPLKWLILLWGSRFIRDVSTILRRRLLVERDFLNTKKYARVSQRYFGRKTR